MGGLLAFGTPLLILVCLWILIDFFISCSGIVNTNICVLPYSGRTQGANGDVACDGYHKYKVDTFQHEHAYIYNSSCSFIVFVQNDSCLITFPGRCSTNGRYWIGGLEYLYIVVKAHSVYVYVQNLKTPASCSLFRPRNSPHLSCFCRWKRTCQPTGVAVLQ